MARSTFPRWLAVLTFALLGATMTFLAGAHAGAALNGRVNAFTIGSSPLHGQAAQVVPGR
jgi:hypothetical protein